MAEPDEINEVVNSALLLARSRAGRMAAVGVAVPTGREQALVAAAVAARLAACGYPDLEVMVHPTAGPMRLTSAEFER